MNNFKPGDIIRQKGQIGAADRIVLNSTSDGLYLVSDGTELGVRLIFGWSHYLIREGTELEGKLAIAALEEPWVNDAFQIWKLGTKCNFTLQEAKEHDYSEYGLQWGTFPQGLNDG